MANVQEVLTAQTLIARPDFSVATWDCTGGNAGWSEPECPIDGRFVLVRSGCFRRRGPGGAVEHDATLGYLGAPGESEQFAHSHGGDRCTSVQLSAPNWWQLAGEPRRTGPAAVYVDARLELTHRRLLATHHHDPDYQLAESLVQLVGTALRAAAQRPMPAADAPSRPADRRMVAQARDAIRQADDTAVGLFSLAGALGVSAYRLSRSFSNELGVSVTRYRNRVRVGKALDLLQRGESTMADIAAGLGFADQAHLCRTVRQHTGCTPTAVRRELRQVSPGQVSRPMSSTRTEWVSAPIAR
ncbi:AraC family transcriptional regulator [Mycobacterium sp. NPDC050441]|uniref:helix-turn-helix domain-containing protein n=1 Tax=Mycobacterium sp. NPDC050441 TaxID=3155403 RepID=UPI0033EEB30A